MIEVFRDFEPAREDVRGDHDLNAINATKSNREAAVLFPIIKHPEGLRVMFTKRTDHLTHHPGQISFPGGHHEKSDPSFDFTALRETEEEVGLGADHIQIIGRLNDYITRTGFRVTPIIGLIDSPYPTAPDPHEVAEVFEVPLSFLMDETNHERCTRQFKGATRHFWAMPYNDYYIWGATAGMIRNFYEFVENR